jgi:hypothetical protein
MSFHANKKYIKSYRRAMVGQNCRIVNSSFIFLSRFCHKKFRAGSSLCGIKGAYAIKDFFRFGVWAGQSHCGS